MSDVAAAYDRNPQHEWERLKRDAYHSLEYEITMRFLRAHLPASGRILDAGGGPGRYSLALCRAGFDVVLTDISAGCIAEAQRQFASEPSGVQARLLSASVADIRDLSALERHAFDVVLCLGGPLTHLARATDRVQAVHELSQMARPGAVICLSVMGRLDALRRTLTLGPDHVRTVDLAAFVASGDTTVAGMQWHFFRAEELRHLAESAGLSTHLVLGCEGLSSSLPEPTNRLAVDREQWSRWLDLVSATATETSVADVSGHILWVGRAPA